MNTAPLQHVAVVEPSTGEELDRSLKAETGKAAAVIKSAKISVE